MINLSCFFEFRDFYQLKFRLFGFFCFDWQFFVDVSMDSSVFVFRVKKSVNHNSSRGLDPEGRGRTIVQNVGKYLPIDTA